MIIGLVGIKQSGKTTSCNIIKKYLDNVVQVNFKDALVQEMKENFPDLLEAILASGCYSYSDSEKPIIDQLFDTKPPLMRALMQNYGTNVRRKDNPNYWTDKWTYAVAKNYPEHHILVDDVRFLNEAKAVKELGGILIRLDRPDMTNNDTHQSEQEQTQIEADYTISIRQGELQKLEEELIKILHG